MNLQFTKSFGQLRLGMSKEEKICDHEQVIDMDNEDCYEMPSLGVEQEVLVVYRPAHGQFRRQVVQQCQLEK